MAKKDMVAGNDNLPENANSEVSLAGADIETHSEGASTEAHAEGDIDANGLVSVVVLKGHTLYHDGDKYPPTSRLKVSPEDADTLQSRGVVVPYSELLQQLAGYVG